MHPINVWNCEWTREKRLSLFCFPYYPIGKTPTQVSAGSVLPIINLSWDCLIHGLLKSFPWISRTSRCVSEAKLLPLTAKSRVALFFTMHQTLPSNGGMASPLVCLMSLSEHIKKSHLKTQANTNYSGPQRKERRQLSIESQERPCSVFVSFLFLYRNWIHSMKSKEKEKKHSLVFTHTEKQQCKW